MDQVAKNALVNMVLDLLLVALGVVSVPHYYLV